MKTSHTPQNPYDACKRCKTLLDCPYREVLEDGMGTAEPPMECIRADEIRTATEKAYRKIRRK